VDFFRIDRSGPTKRLLAIGAVLVALGASTVGAHLVTRLSATLTHYVSLGGGLTMLVGLVLAFGAMAMMLFEDVYLAIADQHVVLHDNGKETRIAWEDLSSVVADGSGYVALARSQGEPLRWYAGKQADLIAGKLQEARRKALHGLLKTSSHPPPAATS